MISRRLMVAARATGVAVFLAIPTTVVAQVTPEGGKLRLFSDADLTSSTYQDQSLSSLTVYVVHSDVPSIPVLLISFMIAPSSGLTFIWAGETSPMYPLVFGDSRTGITLGYNACLAPDPGLILEIHYVAIGTSGPCSSLQAIAHPDSHTGEVEAGMCAGVGPYPVAAEDLSVNCPLPVTETTWGRVKSLYRQR